jgi:ribosomal protein L11 methyltransferase
MRRHQMLWFLRFFVPARVAEAVGAALEDDAVAVTVLAPPRHPFSQIEAIYGHEQNATEISVKLAVLAATFGFAAPEFTLLPAPKLDWLKKVAEDFPPLKIARWTIHGARHRGKVQNRLFALQIDATNAFGTGEHPTTRGCLLMLDKILKTGFCPRRMADIGCGSGILAMACVEGARGEAVGVDLDPDSVQIAAKNIRINGLGTKIRVCRGRGYAPPLLRKAAPYDLIMANIFANPLCQMARDLKKNLNLGGVAILSGILSSQAKKVIAIHKMQGLSLAEHRILGEWSVLALTRSKGIIERCSVQTFPEGLLLCAALFLPQALMALSCREPTIIKANIFRRVPNASNFYPALRDRRQRLLF